MSMWKATHIQWDTDGEDVSLPNEIIIPESVIEDQVDDECSIEDKISEYISDVTGFCHKGFCIEKR